MQQLRKHPILVLLLVFVLSIGACHVARSAWYLTSNITDYKIFPSRVISNGNQPESLPYATDPKFPKSITYDHDSFTVDEFMKEHKTVAFLILWKDSIQYEGYYNGYVDSSITTSFSMAKSIVSLLTGCAIQEGYIGGVDDPVLKYLPELKGRGFDSMHIKNLLQMTADLDFKESYINPFTTMPKFYYGRHINKETFKLKSKYTSESKFNYQSPSTQILALILTRALKDKTLSQYLQEKIWTPMQMEFPATWSLDQKNGMEKAFCCVNARARDFAKLGLLVKNFGEWKGQQLVPREWIRQCMQVDTANGSAKFYEYQWWHYGNQIIYANGHLGQYIFVKPDSDLVIVRLGENYGKVFWPALMFKLSQAYGKEAFLGK
ncbi:MAG: serine hydrolase [Bacteroidetes bacterium]|nr:serine hydrolase [Bacteroidota bacterium]